MTENTVKMNGNVEIKNDLSERFIVFVATKERPIVSFSNFERAERLAIFFAGLTNTQMEVFDSEKEICYFVEPSEMKRPTVH